MPEDRKLGKESATPEKAAPRFGEFTAVVPDHPPIDPPPTYTYPMDGNDRWGDCVVAGWDHLRQIVTGLLTGTPRNYTLDQIIEFYKTQNPNFPTQDEGMYIQEFLGFLQRNGHIVAFARIDHTNHEEVKAAVYLGYGIMIGVVLADAQVYDQWDRRLWDVDPASPEAGGHCVTWAGYLNEATVTAVSWGDLVDMTWRFISAQCDEAWFVLTEEHIARPDFRAGFDLSRFAQAFTDMTGRPFPIVVPDPVPDPPPQPPPPEPTPVPDPVTPPPRPPDARTWWEKFWDWVIDTFFQT